MPHECVQSVQAPQEETTQSTGQKFVLQLRLWDFTLQAFPPDEAAVVTLRLRP
jgi:hypothetical protein